MTRRQDPQRAPHAGRKIANRRAHAQRSALLGAGDAHQSRHALSDLVDARPTAVRPRRAKAADARIDQFGVVAAKHVVAQTHLVGDAGLEVLDEDVGLPGELLQQGESLWRSEVDGQAALVAVDAQEVGTFSLVERPEGAQQIAARCRFDLGDIGAEVAQDHGAERPRRRTREIEYPDSLERRLHRTVPPASFLPVSLARSGAPRPAGTVSRRNLTLAIL